MQLCAHCALVVQLVLTMASPKIAAMLKEGKSEVRSGVHAMHCSVLTTHSSSQIEVTDTTPDVFNLLLDFIYCDKV